MPLDIHDKAAVERRLWTDIGDTGVGMLGLTGSPLDHLQPMSAFAEPETGTLWFYTRNDSDLAQSCGQDRPASFVFVSKNRELQASLHGTLRTAFDPLHRDKFWSPVVSAWYPKGKSDPHLTMLRFDSDDARVWISDCGPARFAWEIAKANLTGATPAVGGVADLTLS